jgi:hypothetical protein
VQNMKAHDWEPRCYHWVGSKRVWFELLIKAVIATGPFTDRF